MAKTLRPELGTSLDSSDPGDDIFAQLVDQGVFSTACDEEPSPELEASPGCGSSTGRDTSSDTWSNPRAVVDRTSRRRPATVLYSHLPFLAVGNIHRIPFEDVNYLESQGCLHVPTRPMLDNFVEQYFLHVHPLLPLLDKGEFWDMYSQADAPCPQEEKVSLLLFQAMIYSSCTYVPFEIVRGLGFSSLRGIRAELYRRVRVGSLPCCLPLLLYDLDTETASLPLAQTALLLMSWVPPSNLASNPYRTWLGHALQHARSINADRSGSAGETPVTATASPGAKRHHRACRRLWWCCVIFDRISPLCTRFGHRITRETFDFAGATPLGMQDLEGEIYRSSVYSPAAKRRLIGLFEVYLEFVLLLTDVLTLVFPFEDSLRAKYRPRAEDGARIEACGAALKSWFARASARFPPFEGHPASAADSVKTQDMHRSEALHVNLMYIYYYTAKIALHHYRVIYHVARGQDSESAAVSQAGKLEQSRGELMDAAAHMTLLFGELSRRRLVRWLPISAVACIAMPLALNVISARLSAVGNELSFDRPASARDSGAGRQQRLDYEGVEWVRETAKYAANLAQASSQATTAPFSDAGSSPPTMTDWTQILAAHPDAYIRTTMAVDLCISKGRVPQDDDFPAWLFSRLTLDPGQASAPGATANIDKQDAATASDPTGPLASSPRKPTRRRASGRRKGSPDMPPGSVSWPSAAMRDGRGEQAMGEGDDPQRRLGPRAAGSAMSATTTAPSGADAVLFADLDPDQAITDLHNLGFGFGESALQDGEGPDWSFMELLGLAQPEPHPQPLYRGE
ncbi:hypothetical protein Micbo1qcDRAFT_151449 [Microdochium bolleyi]|uniref:Xylanolytic transcriptional activator regulatory domain-containing protein n=1 Tax=Microdochium bolleyi TaxID=196109 RepID=A0A136ISP4_9PEZI|nr:hypothetical protein Micbo1qcDRAFT_151449 [Microdochium bolleyi]